MHTCASLTCEENTPATIPMYVFVAGGSYPLWVCTTEHGRDLIEAGRANDADVRFITGRQDS